jgi:hypothetical protein
VAEEDLSVMSEEEVDDLARKVLDIVGAEEPNLGNKLNRSAIHNMLVGEVRD